MEASDSSSAVPVFTIITDDLKADLTKILLAKNTFRSGNEHKVELCLGFGVQGHNLFEKNAW